MIIPQSARSSPVPPVSKPFVVYLVGHLGTPHARLYTDA